MITPGTAELVLGVAKALIKFGGQLDRLLAEKVAVQSPLALKLPAVNFSPGPGVLKPKLRAYLQETSEEVPGPLGKKKRKELASLMSASSPDLATMRRFYALAFPDEALAEGDAAGIAPPAVALGQRNRERLEPNFERLQRQRCRFRALSWLRRHHRHRASPSAHAKTVPYRTVA